MKTTATLLVAGSMIAAATPAMAQDSSEFDGFRVEALAGYDVTQAGSSVDTEGENDESIEGLSYGVGVGYDFDAGGVVLGLEGEFVGSTAEVEIDDGDIEAFGIGNVSAGRDLYVGARVGTKLNDDLLLYAKGGYTNVTFDIRTTDGVDDFEAQIDTDGWRAGLGLEYALSGNSFAKVEYRYSNYSSAEIDYEGDTPDTDLGEIDLDRHQVMVGFGMRF